LLSALVPAGAPCRMRLPGDLPVPGSLELMRVRQGRAIRTASVSLSISPSPLAAKA